MAYQFQGKDALRIISYLEKRPWDWWEDSPLEDEISFSYGLSEERRRELHELRGDESGLNEWLYKNLLPEQVQRLRMTLRKDASKRGLRFQRVRADLTRSAHDRLLRAKIRHKEQTGKVLTISDLIEMYVPDK
jgi:hypothetical protein